jgi:predicted PurR-regulated permease PerM
VTTRQSNARAFTSLSIPVWILALVAVTFVLREARTLFVPVALAILIAAAVSPIVCWFDRIRVPRSVSAAIVVGVFTAAAGWCGWVLSDDVAQMAQDLPQQIRQLRGELQSSATGGVLDDLNQAANEATAPPPADGAVAQEDEVAPAPAPAGPRTGSLATYLWEGSANLFSVAGHVSVITLLVYFLLVGGFQWHDRIVRLLGTMLSSRRTGAEVVGEITLQVQRFLVMRLWTSLFVAVVTWIALVVLDAPAPGVWSVAAGVFNWVPYFGPIIVSGGLAIVGFVAGGMSMALQISLVAMVITSVEGSVLTPLVMGRATRMNTLAIFVSLLFWSWVWGIWGTILAVPLTSVIKAIADHVEPLYWLSDLLAADKGAAASEPAV